MAALRSYARWRNRYRAEPGVIVWMPLEAPEHLSSWKHRRRSLRYVHLNPCRDGLAPDPLTWPFSTHRDFVGLSVPGCVAVEHDPSGFHAYVSGDPSVRVDGTSLPFSIGGVRGATPEQVLGAVSALSRQPVARLFLRGGDRVLLLRCLSELTDLGTGEIARWVGVAPSTVWRSLAMGDDRVAVVERVLGDPRFPALYDGRLDFDWSWRRYRESRERKGVPALLASQARQRTRRERAWRDFER